MKILTHPAFTALGAATLCLLILIDPLVSLRHLEIYHLSGSAHAIFVPVLMLLGMAWLMFAIPLWLARKPGWFRTILWTSLIVLSPWMLLKDWLVLTGSRPAHWFYSVVLLAPTVIPAIVLLTRHPRFVLLFTRLQDFAAVLLGFVSISGLLMVCQLVWFGWQARALNVPLPLHQHQQPFTSAVVSPRPKIIWILFDELSYQQVYDRRFPGLSLPAFDQLASESTVFTHVVPAGIATDRVVPSLMTGIRVDQISVSADGQRLALYDSSQRTWATFNPNQSVFRDALDAGYRTAVAGWYNPYCRILPQVLDYCFWSSHLGVAGGIYPDQAIAWNISHFVLRRLQHVLARTRISPLPQGSAYDKQFRQRDYLELFAAADSLLVNSSANFIFLHMPVPHPDGFYDRRRADFTTGSASYIDNLALADRYLAHVRDVLQQRGEWDSSAVVVMGDHSWRTKLVWSWSPSWTPEDQAASQNAEFDDRPAYIVKLPGQQQSARIDASFNALHTRALFDELLHGRLRTPEDLAVWTSQPR